MREQNLILFVAVFIIFLTGCELPESPDFKIEHKFDVAFSKQKSYQFLGAKASFIDTTKRKLRGICASGRHGSSLPSNNKSLRSGSMNSEMLPASAMGKSKGSKVCEIDISEFSFAANNVQFKDTMKADLSELPDKESKLALKDAIITINYVNGLPLDLEIDVRLFDESRNKLIYRNDLKVEAGTIGNDGFVKPNGKMEGKTTISLKEDELRQLHNTQYLVLKTTTNTSGKKTVRIGGTDALAIDLDVSVDVRSIIN